MIGEKARRRHPMLCVPADLELLSSSFPSVIIADGGSSGRVVADVVHPPQARRVAHNRCLRACSLAEHMPRAAQAPSCVNLPL